MIMNDCIVIVDNCDWNQLIVGLVFLFEVGKVLFFLQLCFEFIFDEIWLLCVDVCDEKFCNISFCNDGVFVGVVV